MIADLKPCPFCGSNKLDFGRVFGTQFSGDLGYYLQCRKCECRTAPKGTKHAVKKLWNRRIDDVKQS